MFISHIIKEQLFKKWMNQLFYDLCMYINIYVHIKTLDVDLHIYVCLGYLDKFEGNNRYYNVDGI